MLWCELCQNPMLSVDVVSILLGAAQTSSEISCSDLFELKTVWELLVKHFMICCYAYVKHLLICALALKNYFRTCR